MGFLGLFGSKKPNEKAIEKQVNRVKERYAQPDYRRMAMDQLLEWDTPESLDAVLLRLTVVVQSPHWDEDEKRWLMTEMIKRGDVGKEALQRFIMAHNEVTYALSALTKLCTENELEDFVLATLKKRPPEDHRSTQGKMELIAFLESLNSPQINEALVPYLADHHDDVQCITLDVIKSKQAIEGYPKMLEMISNEFLSPRVLRHAALAISELGLRLDPQATLAPEVAEDYQVKDGKLVKKR